MIRSFLCLITLTSIAHAMEIPENINTPDAFGRTPLFCAILFDDTETAKRLLAFKAIDVNAKSTDKSYSPLLAAIEMKNRPIIDLLLAHSNIDINITTKEGLTPLHAAAIAGQLEITQQLLAKGANSNAQDDYGWTPLFWATQNMHDKIVLTLLAHQEVAVNITDIDNDTALHIATNQGDALIVTYFLNHPGIEIAVKNKNGYIPAAQQEACKYKGITELFLNALPSIELPAPTIPIQNAPIFRTCTIQPHASTIQKRKINDITQE